MKKLQKDPLEDPLKTFVICILICTSVFIINVLYQIITR